MHIIVDTFTGSHAAVLPSFRAAAMQARRLSIRSHCAGRYVVRAPGVKLATAAGVRGCGAWAFGGAL